MQGQRADQEVGFLRLEVMSNTSFSEEEKKKNKKIVVKIYKGDNPFQKAEQICSIYNLPESRIESIRRDIQGILKDQEPYTEVNQLNNAIILQQKLAKSSFKQDQKDLKIDQPKRDSHINLGKKPKEFGQIQKATDNPAPVSSIHHQPKFNKLTEEKKNRDLNQADSKGNLSRGTKDNSFIKEFLQNLNLENGVDHGFQKSIIRKLNFDDGSNSSLTEEVKYFDSQVTGFHGDNSAEHPNSGLRQKSNSTGVQLEVGENILQDSKSTFLREMESFITKSPSNVNFTSASAKKFGVHSQRSKLSDIGSSKNLENFKNEGKKGKNLQMPIADEYMLVEKNGIQNKLSTKHIQVRIDYGSSKPSIEKISSQNKQTSNEHSKRPSETRADSLLKISGEKENLDTRFYTDDADLPTDKKHKISFSGPNIRGCSQSKNKSQSRMSLGTQEANTDSSQSQNSGILKAAGKPLNGLTTKPKIIPSQFSHRYGSSLEKNLTILEDANENSSTSRGSSFHAYSLTKHKFSQNTSSNLKLNLDMLHQVLPQEAALEVVNETASDQNKKEEIRQILALQNRELNGEQLDQLFLQNYNSISLTFSTDNDADKDATLQSSNQLRKLLNSLKSSQNSKLRPILSSQQSPKLAKDFQGSDSQQKIEVNNFNAEIGDVKSNSIGRSSDLRKTSSLKFDIKTRRNSSSELKVPLLDLERVQNNLIGVQNSGYLQAVGKQESHKQKDQFPGCFLDDSIKKIVINRLQTQSSVQKSQTPQELISPPEQAEPTEIFVPNSEINASKVYDQGQNLDHQSEGKKSKYVQNPRFNNFKRSNSAYTLQFLNRSSISQKKNQMPKSKSFVEKTKKEPKIVQSSSQQSNLLLPLAKTRNAKPSKKKGDSLFSSDLHVQGVGFSSLSRNYRSIHESRLLQDGGTKTLLEESETTQQHPNLPNLSLHQEDCTSENRRRKKTQIQQNLVRSALRGSYRQQLIRDCSKTNQGIPRTRSQQHSSHHIQRQSSYTKIGTSQLANGRTFGQKSTPYFLLGVQENKRNPRSLIPRSGPSKRETSHNSDLIQQPGVSGSLSNTNKQVINGFSMFHKKKSSNEVYKKMFANIIQKSKQLLNSNNNMGVPKHATVANKDGTKPIQRATNKATGTVEQIHLKYRQRCASSSGFSSFAKDKIDDSVYQNQIPNAKKQPKEPIRIEQLQKQPIKSKAQTHQNPHHDKVKATNGIELVSIPKLISSSSKNSRDNSRQLKTKSGKSNQKQVPSSSIS